MAEESVDPAEDDVQVNPAAVTAQDAQNVNGDDAEDNYSWDDDADQESGEDADAGESDQEESGEYEFNLGEETQIPEVIHGDLGSLAKELGLPGDKAAALLNRGLEIYQKAHEAANKELGRELRKEWGPEFDAKLKATKIFAAKLGREAGLKAEDMAVMMSPYGVRLLNAMREKLGEGGFAGRAAASPMTTQQKLDAFYANSEKMAAVLDASHPLYESANKELNQLYGIK